jgi:hypothetical protein
MLTLVYLQRSNFSEISGFIITLSLTYKLRKLFLGEIMQKEQLILTEKFILVIDIPFFDNLLLVEKIISLGNDFFLFSFLFCFQMSSLLK